jgi:hypothetical protein
VLDTVQHIVYYVLCFICLRLVYGGVQHILCYVLCFIYLRLVYGDVQHILCYVLCFVCLCPLYNKVCQWLAADRWFSLDTSVCSTNKTDRHDIAGIFLKVALSTMILTPIIVFLLLIIYNTYCVMFYVLLVFVLCLVY